MLWLHWTYWTSCHVTLPCVFAVQYVVARHGHDSIMHRCGAIPRHGGFSSFTSLVCYLFNHLLTFLIFQESNLIGFLIGIVPNDGINCNSSLHPLTPNNKLNGRCHQPLRTLVLLFVVAGARKSELCSF